MAGTAIIASDAFAKEGFVHKPWGGELITDGILVNSNASFGRGVIDAGNGEVQIPDRDNVLGNGATTDEANKFIGIIKGRILDQIDCVARGEIAAPVLATPIGRDDKGFYNENTVIPIFEVGFVGDTPEEAVTKGDQVTLRVAGADNATGKVLGGFGTTATADVLLVLDGLYWGADSDALGSNFIKMNIK